MTNDEISRFTPLRDENPDVDRVGAELVVYPGAMNPSEVTKLTGLRPTRTVVVGQRSSVNSLGLSSVGETNGWFLSSEGLVKSKDIRRHLDWLLAKLTEARSGLRELQGTVGARMYICCVFWTNSGGGSATLWPEQMHALAELNLECTFAFADYGEPDLESSKRSTLQA